MSENEVQDPGGGVPPPGHPPPSSSPTPDQLSPTYAKAVGGATGSPSQLKKYAEIIAHQKSQRNVLEVKIRKITSTGMNPPKHLTLDDISEFIFENLNLQFEECVGVDFFTGRFDTKEILLKPGIDSSKYITSEPIVYKEHEIEVKKMLNDITKVTFRNVPMYVPDEEILHLCGIYGTVVDNKVYWEKMRFTTSTKKGVLVSPTRFVNMNLNNGAAFNNFYWMEGPMSGDPGRRITVLHHGQKQQCYNCFKTANTGCKGAGNGKACFRENGERAKMSTYMLAIKTTTGYESLKTKYMRQLAKNHPDLQGEPTQLNTTLAGDMDSVPGDEDEEDREISMGILPINPIVEKDKEIADLLKTVESLKSQLSIIPSLEKGLEEARAENKNVLNISRQVGRRLSVSRRANEQKMVSVIQTGTNWTEDSAHLACSHAATLNDDEFELDDATDTVKPKNKNFNFLKKVEEFLEPNNSIEWDRLNEMKRLILEQMKTTIKKKADTRGEKRGPETESEENAQSKIRVHSPPKV